MTGPPPLYQQVMGDDFGRMPAEVQALHNFRTLKRASGRGSVTRGENVLARVVGYLFRFPPAALDVPVNVTFDVDQAGETWTRDFDGHRFSSRLSSRIKGDRRILTERFGAFTFDFDLSGDHSGLEMRLSGWNCLGLTLPNRLLPRIMAIEQVKEGRFRFDVMIALSWGPLIIRYQGWLSPDPAAP